MAKVNLFPDFKELFELLNSAKVKYLVVGGYAVNHYGHRRATDDIDIWIATDPQNAALVSSVLKSFGFAASKVPASMFREKGKVFIFGREPVRIDFLTGPDGVNFEECYARKNIVGWDGVKVPLISFNDLIANKRAAGRAKDIADLEGLPPILPAGAKKKSAGKQPRRKRK